MQSALRGAVVHGCFFVQQNPSGAIPRGDILHQTVVYQENREEQEKHHVVVLSSVQESTDILPLVGDGSRAPQWWRARRPWKVTIGESLLDDAETVRREWFPPCSVEVTRNQINMFCNHQSSKAQQHFLPNATFLCMTIVNVEGQDSKGSLAAECLPSKM